MSTDIARLPNVHACDECYGLLIISLVRFGAVEDVSCRLQHRERLRSSAGAQCHDIVGTGSSIGDAIQFHGALR